MKRSNRKPGEYIYLSWDGHPDYYAVNGHVTKDILCNEILREEGTDLSEKDTCLAYMRISGIGCYIFSNPKQGRIPVTVCYV
jgi:hypothetical protein